METKPVESQTSEKQEQPKEPEFVFPPIRNDQIGLFYFDMKTQTFWAGLRIHTVDRDGAERFWDTNKMQLYFLYKQKEEQEKQRLALSTQPQPKLGLGGMMRRIADKVRHH